MIAWCLSSSPIQSCWLTDKWHNGPAERMCEPLVRELVGPGLQGGVACLQQQRDRMIRVCSSANSPNNGGSHIRVVLAPPRLGQLQWGIRCCGGRVVEALQPTRGFPNIINNKNKIMKTSESQLDWKRRLSELNVDGTLSIRQSLE